MDWDDEDKRLKVQLSEVLNKKYQITHKDANKKGVFSSVVLAQNVETG
jgi:hypothetical protein